MKRIGRNIRGSRVLGDFGTTMPVLTLPQSRLAPRMEFRWPAWVKSLLYCMRTSCVTLNILLNLSLASISLAMNATKASICFSSARGRSTVLAHNTGSEVSVSYHCTNLTTRTAHTGQAPIPGEAGFSQHSIPAAP
jgi:hypothetical protein